MKQKFISVVRSLLHKFDLDVTRYSELQDLRVKARTFRAYDLQFLRNLPPNLVASALDCLEQSKSQLRQDLFALSCVGFKREGYFVEFGATDGINLSNSWLLEKHFQWSGILAEPARRWHGALRQNRQCSIEFDCVWRESGKSLEFREVDTGELSTLAEFSSSDFHAEKRKSATSYLVHTISLMDMLEKYEAPASIDYLSVDTEGSELEILSAFDFDRYRFSVITCEHNFTKDREKIQDLLREAGYRRVLENISKFDDWYVASEKIQNASDS